MSDQTIFKTIATFDGTNGANPIGTVLIDANGNLFGATTDGGTNNLGTAFEIVNTADGYETTPTTLTSLTANGAYPNGGLVMDSAGDLYGVTTLGPAPTGDGAIYTLVPDAQSPTGYDNYTIATFSGAEW